MASRTSQVTYCIAVESADVRRCSGKSRGFCRERREVYMSHRQAERGNGTGETQNGHK